MSNVHEKTLRATPRAAQPNRPVNVHYEALLGSLHRPNWDARRPQVIGFVGASTGSGVSTVACNLAVEAARDGLEKVLLIDANLDQPHVHRLFSVDPKPGLLQAMTNDLPVETCIRRSEIEMLSLLTCGSDGPAGASGFRPRQFAAVLNGIRGDYDLIVVDLPQVSEVGLSFTLAGMLDGVVLVVEAERESVDKLKRVKQKFVQANAKLLGVVLNKCRRDT